MRRESWWEFLLESGQIDGMDHRNGKDERRTEISRAYVRQRILKLAEVKFRILQT
jgi:hypothetical protein